MANNWLMDFLSKLFPGKSSQASDTPSPSPTATPTKEWEIDKNATDDPRGSLRHNEPGAIRWQGLDEPGAYQKAVDLGLVSPTPTPDPNTVGVLGTLMQMLGTGTTWAVNDKPNFPDSLTDYVNNSGAQYQIDPIILASQIANESGGYNYKAVPGTSGEQGISQIIPKWHAQGTGYSEDEYGKKLATDNKYAIAEQARILGSYLKGQGNIFDALRQYNAGGNLDAGTNYATQILKRAGLDSYIGGTGVDDLSL